MNKLHPIKNDIKTTLWCGPAALSTVTGRPVSECMQAIRDARTCNPSKPIKGVSYWVLEKAANRLGYKFETLIQPWEYLDGRPTLAAWARKNKEKFSSVPVIVCVTGHYVSVAGRKFCDNHTKVPVLLKNAPHRRKRIKTAWRVVPAPAPEENTPEQMAERAEAALKARDLQKMG